MKKQGFKKLALSRETLRTLDEKAIREVAGANTKQNSCDTITWRTCATECACSLNTCTTSAEC